MYRNALGAKLSHLSHMKADRELKKKMTEAILDTGHVYYVVELTERLIA